MRYFDSDFNAVAEPDFERGTVDIEQREYSAKYVIDQEEVGEYQTVREYPNGGKDVAWVTATPEEGHWVCKDWRGEEFEPETPIPEDFPHEQVMRGIESIGIYRLFTDEEIAERERQREAAEAEAAKIEMREAMLDELPETLADSDAAICELYETTLAQSDTIAEQDAAICEIYEMLIGGAE